MDFTGMKPSDALEKAHEAHPEIGWCWSIADASTGSCCTVGLLGEAIGELRNGHAYRAVDKMFSGLPGAESHDMWIYQTAGSISRWTLNARSFPEAIELLRARGW